MQLEVWPFEGDSGVALGPPTRGLRGVGWSADSRVVYRLAPPATGRGRLELTALDPASGQSRTVRTVPDSLAWLDLSDHGVLSYRSAGGTHAGPQEGTPGEWTLLIPEDSMPRHFRFPDSTDFVLSMRASQDGRLVRIVTYRARYVPDTALTFTLYQARAGELGVAVAELPTLPNTSDYNLIRGGPSDVVEMTRTDGDASRWIRVESGHPPRDLGPWPYQEWPALSDDGRRGVVTSTEDHTDVWLLTWPSH